MKNLANQIILLLITVNIFSCKLHKNDNSITLEKATEMLSVNLDSTILILKSIDSEELDDQQLADYTLINLQAKHKNGEDIASETSIFQAKNYYSGKGEQDKLALALYYSGRVLHAQNDDSKAIINYLKALKLAKSTKDERLEALIHFSIGELHYRESDFDQAIDNFKTSQLLFRKNEDKANETTSLLMIGNCYNLKEDNDSSFHYFSKALDEAKYQNDSLSLVSILLNIGTMFCETGEFQQAKMYTLKALFSTKDIEQQAHCYINLTNIFNFLEMPDSAIYFGKKGIALLNSIDKLTDDTFPIYVYDVLSTLEEEYKNYEDALFYRNKYADYADSLYAHIVNQRISVLKENYQYKTFIEEIKKIKKEKNNFLYMIIVLLVIISFTLYVLYRLFRVKAKLTSEVLELNNMIHSGERLNNLFQGLEIMKEVSQLENFVHTEALKPKVKNIIEKINWDSLYPLLNEIHKGRFDLLKEKLASLDETEFKVCCLDYSGFINSEIATILRMKISIIAPKKTKIRQKLGMENNASFKQYFDLLGTI